MHTLLIKPTLNHPVQLPAKISARQHCLCSFQPVWTKQLRCRDNPKDWDTLKDMVTLVTHPNGLGCMLQREILCHQEVPAVSESTLFSVLVKSTVHYMSPSGHTIWFQTTGAQCFTHVCTACSHKTGPHCWPSGLFPDHSVYLAGTVTRAKRAPPSTKHVRPAHAYRCGWTTS